MYIQANAQQSLTVPVGELISLSSFGEGQTIIEYSTEPSAYPTRFYEVMRLDDEAVTLGPFAADRVVRVTSNGAQVEYSISVNPKLRETRAKDINYDDGLKFVAAADTFTTLTYEDDSGSVKLVSAGAHGLTTAVSVGASIYVEWDDAGVNGFYEITALDSDTTGVEITIEYAYDTGFGTPTVSVAGDAVNVSTKPLLGDSVGYNGYMNIFAVYTMVSSANDKIVSITLGGETILDYTATTSASLVIDKSFMAANGKLYASPLNNAGYGASSSAITEVDFDGSVRNDIVFAMSCEVANEPITLNVYKVKAWY